MGEGLQLKQTPFHFTVSDNDSLNLTGNGTGVSHIGARAGSDVRATETYTCSDKWM